MAAPVDAGAAYTHPAGTALAYNTDGSTWVTVADVQKVKAPGIKFNPSDSTPLSATAETDTPGMRAKAEAAFTLFMKAAQIATLIGLATAKTHCNWRVQWPLLTGQSTNSMLTWTGYVMEFEPGEQARNSDDKVSCDFKTNVTGGSTAFTAAT